MINQNLDQELQVQNISDETIYYKNGDIGLALELEPIDVSTKSTEELNQIDEALKNLICSLPEKSQLQFVLENKVNAYETLREKHKNLSVKGASPLSLSLLDNRLKTLQKKESTGAFLATKIISFVRIPFNKTSRKKSFFRGLIFNDKAIKDSHEKDFQATNLQVIRFQNEIKSLFSSSGINTTFLNKEEIEREIFSYWNPSLKDYSFDILSDQAPLEKKLLKSDIEISKDHFVVGSKFCSFLSFPEVPELSFSTMGAYFHGIPPNVKLFFSLHIPEQLPENEKLERQRRVAFSMFSGKTGAKDIESEAKLEDTEDALSRVLRDSEKVLYNSISFLVTENSLEELQYTKKNLWSFIRASFGIDPIIESLANFELFLENAPPNAHSKSRELRTLSSVSAKLLPPLGAWTGHKNPSVLLPTTKSKLIGFNPFDPSLQNYNQLVSGSSGAGKSYLSNQILLQYMIQKPKIYIIDVGGSYKKLCENLGGQYIPFELDSGIQINPFDLATGETTPSEHQKKFLSSFIELITKEEDATGLKKIEKAEIESFIIELYKNEKAPRLQHLKELFLNSSELSIRRFGIILKLWSGESPFGSIIDRPTNINLNSDLVCFDLKGLEMHPDLQSAALFLITNFLWKQMKAHPDQKKFLVFDECWRLLKNKAGSDMIEEVFRTLRKMNGSAIAISQALEDFSESVAASALLNNSSIKWILSQKGSDIKKLGERLKLNENELTLISNLRQHKGHFSECFLMAGDKRAQIRLQSTPLEYWIATTHPEDLKLMNEKLRSHSKEAALMELSKTHPFGA